MKALPTQNERLVLAKRPGRGSVDSETFRREVVPLPKLQDGEVLVRVDYCAIEATMRTWLNDARSYIEPVQVGAVMRALGIGRVLASGTIDFREGDLVYGGLGWQEYWQGPAKDIRHRETPPGGRDIDHLGLFGISGMTAYFGLFDIGRLKDGETVMISGAAGSVGLIATQIALAHPKCKVVAIAGSRDKCEMLKSLGCHAVLNYKDADFKKAFRAAGLIDVYFDNVGGEILDMTLARLKPFARIIACGAISSYSSKEMYGLRNTSSIVSMRAKIQGFIAFDYASRYDEARAYLSSLVRKDKIKYEYHVLEPKPGENGLARCVEGMKVIEEGKNTGKTLIRISRHENKAKL